MRKELITVLGVTVLWVSAMNVLAMAADVGGSILAAATLVVLLLTIVLLYRRMRRSVPEVPSACHAAAAIALLVGAATLIGGVGHSVAVASLTLRESQYGPLQILRLTTGALLVFSGAMTLAMYPGIKAGRPGPARMGAATGVLLWLYLVFTLPLPGTGGTVPAMLGIWSVYLLSLGGAVAALKLHTARCA